MESTPKKSVGKRILEGLLVYRNPRMLLALWLGIASGFPLLLTGTTLVAWMSEEGVDIKKLGLMAMVGLPYTLKFLWAPLVDAVKLSRTQLGQRRAWLLISQIGIVVFLLALAFASGDYGFGVLSVIAVGVSSFSATQDIVIDALRVEMFKTDEQGAASAAVVSGYRIGMLLAGAGALFLAEFISWSMVYLSAALFMVAMMPVAFCIRSLVLAKKEGEEAQASKKTAIAWLKSAVWMPFKDFFQKQGGKIGVVILAFIALYKLGDAMAGNLTMKFYLDLQFSKTEIAGVTKIFGFWAVLAGTAVGGMVVKATRMSRALIFCGILQIASNLVFVWLSYKGHSVTALAVAVAVENITGGMGTAAFVAFMAGLCSIEFTATQYALLSALSSVGRTSLSSVGGFVVDGVGWEYFFIFTAVCGLPGMALLFFLRSQLDREDAKKLALSAETTEASNS